MEKCQLEKIIDFISDFCRISKDKLSASKSLLYDLGIDGDDAMDLLDAYSDKFCVDMSNFKFDEYFGSEGFDFFKSLYELLFYRKKLRLKKLTVGDLVEAAKRGRLDKD